MNIQLKELYEHFLKYPAITADSRKIERNAIFFALKGESFDGNKFALQAIANGCSLAVVDDPKLEKEERCLFVKNVLTALQELAKHHRSQLKIPVIGITGSNGKTTTKELIYTVLSQKYNCLATQGNLKQPYRGSFKYSFHYAQNTKWPSLKWGQTILAKSSFFVGFPGQITASSPISGKPTWRDLEIMKG